MKRNAKFKKILLFAFLFLLSLISINGNASGTISNSITNLKYIEKELVLEVKNYIIKKYPGCPDIIPESIVKYGLEYNIDICFMMAQTEIETCFGKAGIGRSNSRKSIFGVERRKYSNYQECVLAYVQLLKKTYLVKGRTEQDLMRRYVTGSGHRYAQNPRYERELKAAYNNICKKTKIQQLQFYKS